MQYLTEIPFLISGVIHGEKTGVVIAVCTMKAHEGSRGIALPFLMSTNL